MLEIKKGNIFNDQLQALVNPVNTRGVMGGGLALKFKRKYSKYFLEYNLRCNKGEIRIGEVDVFELVGSFWPRYIISFPSKDDWKENSKLSYITDGLDDLVKKIKFWKIKSVGIPALGCGLGRLKWGNVKDVMIEKLDELKDDVHITIYAPGK